MDDREKMFRVGDMTFRQFVQREFFEKDYVQGRWLKEIVRSHDGEWLLVFERRVLPEREGTA